MSNENLTNEKKLLDSLAEKQRAEKLNESQFAKKLGIDRRLWGITRNGKCKIGISLLKAVTRVYPDLIPEVLAILRDGGQGPTAAFCDVLKEAADSGAAIIEPLPPQNK